MTTRSDGIRLELTSHDHRPTDPVDARPFTLFGVMFNVKRVIAVLYAVTIRKKYFCVVG
jgi:hypothetical protein